MQTMQTPLVKSLPILAKMLGRKLGVEVVIGASGAYTDGRVIHLPALPAESEPLAILANGYIDHEAAHVRYTDFAVEKPPGLAGELTNLLEDVRIERALGAAYPGTRANLGRLVAYLAEQDPPVPDPQHAIAGQVLAALYCLLRARLLGQIALTGHAATLERRISEALPAGVVTKLLALAFEVRKTTSTAEVKALALRIVEMLEEKARNDPPAAGESGQSGGSGSDSSAQGTDPLGLDSASGSDAGAGSAAQGHDPAGAESSSGADAGTADDPSQGTSGQSGGDDPSRSGAASGSDAGASGDNQAAGDVEAGDPSAPGTADAARRAALQALLQDGAGAAAGAMDLGQQARQLLDAAAANASAGRMVMAEYDRCPVNPDPLGACREARAASARLRRRLGTLVQASCEDDRWRARRGRRLDSRGLYRLSVDDPAIFARRLERDGPNTAVALLLDRSSSMRDEIGLASRAVLATALALEEIGGVAVWAAAFPGSRSDRVIPLKGFDERASRVAGRFRIHADGGTPLDNALWRAGFELCLRPEPRRLLIVATDGQPDDAGACRQVIARCRAGGIEVLGLGIGLSLAHVQHVFGAREATAIRAIHELAPALFRVLEQRLVVHTA